MKSKPICQRKGCGAQIPRPRTKYCSTKCNIQHYYIDLRLTPKTDKICGVCSAKFKGARNQKYCTAICRLNSHYSRGKLALALVSEEGHPCFLGCGKIVPIRQKYCDDCKWHASVPIADRPELK